MVPEIATRRAQHIPEFSSVANLVLDPSSQPSWGIRIIVNLSPSRTSTIVHPGLFGTHEVVVGDFAWMRFNLQIVDPGWVVVLKNVQHG